VRVAAFVHLQKQGTAAQQKLCILRGMREGPEPHPSQGTLRVLYLSFVAEMLPKVLHDHGSISEYSVGPKVLFDEARDQLRIDLFCILNTKYSGKVIELPQEPENALPAAPLKPESLQLASESIDVLRKRSPMQLLQMPPRLVEMFQHAHPSFFWATTILRPWRNEADSYVEQ
jgi:hypothetical protein